MAHLTAHEALKISQLKTNYLNVIYTKIQKSAENGDIFACFSTYELNDKIIKNLENNSYRVEHIIDEQEIRRYYKVSWG